MVADRQPVGVLGGTFDPVHHAHLRTALELLEDLELAQVRFIPVGQPAHRDQPRVSGKHRLRMLELALEGQQALVADDRELSRPGPSYMVETLESLRHQLGELTPLCLILGMDAFAKLDSWHRWRELLQLAHLLVVHRPGSPLPPGEALGELLAEKKLHHYHNLRAQAAGGIWLQPVSQLDISATRIRQRLAQGYSPRYLLPRVVCDYIQEHDLYRA